MREIGSEFWNVPTSEKGNTLFLECSQWFLSGRSALQAIIKDLKDCHTVAMPSWCCDSMVQPFVDAGMDVHFYPVYWQDGLTQEINLDSDVLFLMDYFGYTGHKPDLNGYKGMIIRDVTHSIFSTTYADADYYFGSLRKWCGVWTGGFAWARDGHPLIIKNQDDFGYVSLRKDAMELKNCYINKYVDIEGKGVADKGYLKIYERAEHCLENVGIAPAAERDVRLAQSLDIEWIRSRRRANSVILRTAFADWLIFPELKENDCPMFVPILVPDGKRNELRQYLINNEIYCPIHWPLSKYHCLDEKTQKLYTDEISLVCDQRYTQDDMERMIDTINRFYKE